MVSTASIDELCRTTLAWLDQHCSLVVLRPGKFIQHVHVVLNSLINYIEFDEAMICKELGGKSPPTGSKYMCPSVISHIIYFR